MTPDGGHKIWSAGGAEQPFDSDLVVSTLFLSERHQMSVGFVALEESLANPIEEGPELTTASHMEMVWSQDVI